MRHRGRRAVSIESEQLRVTVLIEGGHIAEILDKHTGVNPLWTPTWPSIEPSTFREEHHLLYGDGSDGKLLAGIMGHNLCLDIFGSPSAEEASAGLTAHGEASVLPYEIEHGEHTLVARLELPLAQLAFERRIRLEGTIVHIRERVTNRLACDRPIAWTQHVTLGAPFLEKGVTRFRASASRSQVFDGQFGPADYLSPGATFDWPYAPLADGGQMDRRVYTNRPASTAYTVHLMLGAPQAFFVAFSPASGLAFGYVWRASDFPWLGIWEENLARDWSPWNRHELACGMELGVSPFPESRKRMIARGHLFDVPTYRWLPALGEASVTYRAVLTPATDIPDWSQTS